MDTGRHVRKLESESLYDTIRKKWAERVTAISNVTRQTHERVPVEESDQSTPLEAKPIGWALKTTKSRARMGDKVKAFLIEKFEMGIKSGNKADPSSVSKEMKLRMNENGTLVFEPDEWKTAQQIQSFFSRYSATLRQQQVEEEEKELTEEDMEAWETETSRENVRTAIYDDMTWLDHPIEVGSINICQISQAGKLPTLKISQLKVICDTLKLNINGSLARKKSFIEPLEELAKSCSCQK